MKIDRLVLWAGFSVLCVTLLGPGCHPELDISGLTPGQTATLLQLIKELRFRRLSGDELILAQLKAEPDDKVADSTDDGPKIETTTPAEQEGYEGSTVEIDIEVLEDADAVDPIDRLQVWVEEVPGFYDLDLELLPEPDLATSLQLFVTLQEQVPFAQMDVFYKAGRQQLDRQGNPVLDPLGNPVFTFGPPEKTTIKIKETCPDGVEDLQVSLNWTSGADLRLVVVDPNETVLPDVLPDGVTYEDHPPAVICTVPKPPDVSLRGLCWGTEKAPEGFYTWFVQNVSSCPEPAEYTVTVIMRDPSTTISGNVTYVVQVETGVLQPGQSSQALQFHYPAIDLAVSKSSQDGDAASTEFLEFDSLKYRIAVKNMFSAPPSMVGAATGVSISDFFPTLDGTEEGAQALMYLGYVPPDVGSIEEIKNGSGDTIGVIWHIGTLGSDALAQLDINMLVPLGTAGMTIVNQTTDLTSDQFDPPPPADLGPNDVGIAEIQVTETVGLVDLAVQMAVGAERGDRGLPETSCYDELDYIVTITNTPGGADATGISLAAPFPSNLHFVSVKAGAGQASFDAGAGQVFWDGLDLAPGASASLTIRAYPDDTVVATSFTFATLDVQTVGPEADPEEPHEGPDSASAEVFVVDDCVDVSVVKLVTDSTGIPVTEISCFDDFEYRIDVTNHGPSQATNVFLRDVLPAGIQCVDAQAPPPTVLDVVYDEERFITEVSWTIPTLGVGQTVSMVLLAATDDTVVDTVVVNTTSDYSLDQKDHNDLNDVGLAAVYVRDDCVDLQVAKTATDLKGAPITEISCSQVFNFRIQLTNGGVSTATAVSLEDHLPDGLVLLGAEASLGSVTTIGTIAHWEVGTLGPGASAALVLEVGADLTHVGEKLLNQTSGLAADQGDYNHDNDVGSASILVRDDCTDLAVKMTVRPDKGSARATLEFSCFEPFRYTVWLRNNGPSHASGVSIDDVLPPGLVGTDAVASQGRVIIDQGFTALHWEVGDLDAQQLERLEIFAYADETLAGESVTNATSNLLFDQVDPNELNNLGSVVVQIADDCSDLFVLKEAEDTQGKSIDSIDCLTPFRYRVTLGNAGPSNAFEASLSDALPPGLSFSGFVSVPADTLASEKGGLITWSVPALPAFQTRELIFAVVPALTLAGKQVTNQTSGLSFAGVDPSSANDVGTSTLDVNECVDLEVDLSADVDGPLLCGELFDYVIRIDNHGPSTATGVSIDYVLPGGMEFVSVDDPKSASFDGRKVHWSAGGIGALAFDVLRVRVSVDPSLSRITGIDSATSNLQVAQFDYNPENDIGTTSVDVGACANLAVTKVATDLKGNPLPTDKTGKPYVVFEEVFQYRIIVTNTSKVAVTAFEIEDIITSDLDIIDTQYDSELTELSAESQDYSWTLLPEFEFGPGASTMLIFSVRQSDDYTAMDVENCAGLISAVPADSDPSDDVSCVTVLVGVQASYDVVLQDCVAALPAGPVVSDILTLSPFEYRVVVRNDGPDTALGFMVDCELHGTLFGGVVLDPEANPQVIVPPGDDYFVSGEGSQTIVSWGVSNLHAGETRQMIVKVFGTVVPESSCSVSSTSASIYKAFGDTDTTNNTGEADTTIYAAGISNVGVSIAPVAGVCCGDGIAVDVVLTNTGFGTAVGFKLAFEIKSSCGLASIMSPLPDSDGDCDSITIPIQSIAPGETQHHIIQIATLCDGKQPSYDVSILAQLSIPGGGQVECDLSNNSVLSSFQVSDCSP